MSGFVGLGYPAALVDALRARFDATASPRSLGLLVVAAVGDGKGGGLGRLAAPGLLSRLIYAWAGASPEFTSLIAAGGLEAHNLPLGVVSHMIRDVGAGRPGPITRIGLGTFVDPVNGGGKRGPPAARAAARDVVRRVTFPPAATPPGGAPRTFLHYTPPRSIDVALLRGTTADEDGNIAFGREALVLDALSQAIAAHNSGGTVIVQVARVVPAGSIPPRAVIIPGVLVDRVVVVPGPQTLGFGQADPAPDAVAALCGSASRGGGGGGGGGASPPPPTPAAASPLPTGVRRIVARRAMLALGALCTPGSLVNIGVGMAEGVAACVASPLAAADIPASLPLVLSTEAGAIGGAPVGGRLFGASSHAAAHVPTPTMLDLYNGGAVVCAVLGAAEVSAGGDVNVSSFPGRAPGCGGFIDISQSSRAVVFVGTFTSGGLAVAVEKGGASGRQPMLRIVREGRHRKFKAGVAEKTFAGEAGRGRPVLYVTERAVFRLVVVGGGVAAELELIEVAPGIDVARDVLGQMGFAPRLASPLGLMDGRCFE